MNDVHDPIVNALKNNIEKSYENNMFINHLFKSYPNGFYVRAKDTINNKKNLIAYIGSI